LSEPTGWKFLIGRIPAEIGECSSLALLSLAHNSLTGNVPKELAKLRCLKILNLAMNILTGELPQQLGNLGYLLSVNISHNKLKGRIPIGGIFNSLNMTSLEGKYRPMWIRSECFLSHGYA
jgi:Leucine-rich repeat (LRR) protein